LLEQRAERLEDYAARAAAAGSRILADTERRLAHLGALLKSYSYEHVLERGYVLVSDKAGHLLASATAAKPGEAVNLRFHDGSRGAVIDGGDGSPGPAKSAKRDSGPRGPSGNQGSLL
jgi:exodeoxyribonuclease VII large subunit